MNDLINRHELFLLMHPRLRDNFIKLCADGRVGLLPVSINSINIMNTNLVNLKYGYNFKIHIPYAGKSLVWDVLFNPEDFEFAPDFDFNDECFPQVLSIEEVENKIPTLADWNLDDSGVLESTLREWLTLYKEYQIKELNNNNIYSRISSEYNFLVSDGETTDEDIEILVDNNSVHFLISVRVDLGDVPQFIQEPDDDGSLLNPKDNFALLFMVFQKLDASRVNVQLQLSPRLEQLIGKIKALPIPNYKRDEASLVQYVPLVRALLQEQVDEVIFNFHFKKQFVTSLVALRRRSIIEYDSFNFSKVAFLCEVNRFFVLVQITIGDEFPREKPIIKLCSLYCSHPRTKLPCEAPFIKYKHMPGMLSDEMAKHVLRQLKKEVIDFQNHSHNSTLRKY